MNISYLFLSISIVSTIGSITSILSEDYRVLPFLLFFSVGCMVAFIQIRKGEKTPCGCESFWDNDGFCFRCGGYDPKSTQRPSNKVKME